MLLSPEKCLIVAADFELPEINRILWIEKEVLELADELADTGVIIKVNTALRAVGCRLIPKLHERGVGVMADLKLLDIPATLRNDGYLLEEVGPEMLTASCTTGVDSMRALKERLPQTEVLGVTVLTTFDDADAQAMFTCPTMDAVMRLAHLAMQASLDGLVSSPQEAEILRAEFGLLMSLNTPGVRPEWAMVPNDDQKRVMTPAKAIEAGANRVVVGRPITQARNRRDAVLRTIDEIAEAAS